MIDAAEQAGLIEPDTIILEPTSGNTGIALAMVCAARGYKCVLTMPETMSVERRMLLRAFGAELVLTPGPEGMPGAIAKAEELAKTRPPVLRPAAVREPGQPGDPPGNHRRGGLARHRRQGRHLRRRGRHRRHHHRRRRRSSRSASRRSSSSPSSRPRRRCCPAARRARTRSRASARGSSRRSSTWTSSTRSSPSATTTRSTLARRLAREEGLLVGISSGAAAWAALQVARRPENAGKLIVVVLPDFGERYLSTAAVRRRWRSSHARGHATRHPGGQGPGSRPPAARWRSSSATRACTRSGATG